MDTQNPLLSALKLPGRTFQLPSRGALYTAGEVDGVDGEVHVRPMSALTEINLKTPDQLFNGKALEEVFAECVPAIKKPLDLFARDIDAIMFFLRLVTYGPEFEVNVTHTCQGAKSHSYSVNVEEMVMGMKLLDPTLVEMFTIMLPNGQRVQLKPISMRHMIELFQLNAGKTELTPDDVKRNITFNLVHLIDQVDGVSDKALIEGWVKAISTPLQNRIIEGVERLNDWGPAQTTTMICRDCGEEMIAELPLNPVAFFTE